MHGFNLCVRHAIVIVWHVVERLTTWQSNLNYHSYTPETPAMPLDVVFESVCKAFKDFHTLIDVFMTHPNATSFSCLLSGRANGTGTHSIARVIRHVNIISFNSFILLQLISHPMWQSENLQIIHFTRFIGTRNPDNCIGANCNGYFIPQSSAFEFVAIESFVILAIGPKHIFNGAISAIDRCEASVSNVIDFVILPNNL